MSEGWALAVFAPMMGAGVLVESLLDGVPIYPSLMFGLIVGILTTIFVQVVYEFFGDKRP